MNHKIFLAGIIGFMVCACGNIINDIMDINIDRINNPKRPLVAGTVKKNITFFMAIFFSIISLIVSFFLGLKPFFLVILTILLLLVYSMYFKKTPMANIIVAVTAGLSFILGGFITNNIFSLLPAFFALLIHMPREIIKDIIDIKGDRESGVLSLPIIYGEERARHIAFIFLIILLCLSPIPYALGLLNVRYLLVIMVIAIPLIIFTIAKLQNHIFASNLLKIIMLAGLVAFILG